ncbi:unnamed protein product, partial [Ectocarpus fasciculatus]
KHPPADGCGGSDGAAAAAADWNGGVCAGARCVGGDGDLSAEQPLSGSQERRGGLVTEMSLGNGVESVDAPAVAAAAAAVAVAGAGLNGRADSSDVENPQETTKVLHVPLCGVNVVAASSVDAGRNVEEKDCQERSHQHQEQRQQQRQQQQQQQQQQRRRRGQRDAGVSKTHPAPEIPVSRMPGGDEVLAQQYIVQWTGFHPLEDHEGRLSRAL